MTSLVLNPLMLVTLPIEARDPLPGRELIRYWDGAFESAAFPDLVGKVIGGADHGLPRTDGRRHMNARIVLETRDGTPLTFIAQGLGPADGPWMFGGTFEAPPGQYDWLCSRYAVGTATRRDDVETWSVLTAPDPASS